ncbi:hypothetical protein GPK87_14565 [Oscillibacter sp. MCC667]|nr:hypothetical protein [Oscillibacter sp. MCC667]
MNSQERHEARYQRRKARREQRAREAGGASFEEVMSFGNICKAGKSCCDGARWKTSTINFETNLLGEAQATYDTLHYGKRVFKGFHSFATVEHGKVRNIDALPIQERAIQKCLCKNLLTEVYSRSFIYDNSASLKDRGMDFQLRRLRKHLQDHYRRYGTEGGIYQFDFKNYFGSLPHEEIKRRARKKIMDDRLYTLFCDFVDDFRLMKTADKKAHRGVGLGSEVSQIIALDYASPIDHYVKDVRGIHGYGRYMDDGYVISNSLEELEDIKRNLYRLAEALGIAMSDKKNIITPFRHHSFTFLKMRVTLTETGKVVMKLSRKSIRAMRRKMDIFRRWMDEGRMGPEDVFQSYQSWRAHAKRCNSYDTLRAMDERFTRMFAEELAGRRKPFPCTMKATRTGCGWIYRRHGAVIEEEMCA